MEEYKARCESMNKMLHEKDGTIKKAESKLKEQEEEFGVKLIQEKEQLMKRIHSRIFFSGCCELVF